MSEPARRSTTRSGPRARRATGRITALPLAALVATSVALGAAACEPQTESAGSPTTTAANLTTSTGAGSGPDAAGPSEPGPEVTTADDLDPTTTERPPRPTDSVVTGGTTVAHSGEGFVDGSVYTVDLDEMTYPSSVCADVIDRPPRSGYRLEAGQARSAPEDEDPYTVTLQPTRSFGDVNGDGDDDVALVLDCGNESQPVSIGWIYTVDGSGPRPLAPVQLDPDELPFSDVLDTSLRGVRIAGSKVVTDWSVYLDGDALCCPSKTATVTWTWTNGRLAPGTPIFTKAAPGG